MSLVKNLNNFPFAAIIGQVEMKLALQLNVIDPKMLSRKRSADSCMDLTDHGFKSLPKKNVLPC